MSFCSTGGGATITYLSGEPHTGNRSDYFTIVLTKFISSKYRAKIK
jgi:hypothetical protein